MASQKTTLRAETLDLRNYEATSQLEAIALYSPDEIMHSGE
jgi:hypothetical protein